MSNECKWMDVKKLVTYIFWIVIYASLSLTGNWIINILIIQNLIQPSVFIIFLRVQNYKQPHP